METIEPMSLNQLFLLILLLFLIFSTNLQKY